jgi:hypothetical protein
MRKVLYYLIAIVLVGAAAAAIFVATKNTKSHDDKASSAVPAAKKPAALKNACDIFTLADAKQLLGDNAKGGQNPIYESNGNLNVSSCTYTQDQGTNVPVAARSSATLLLRLPNNQDAATGNSNQFGLVKPTDAQDVSGYGDVAFWDPTHGQLNILKSNSWYILSYGPVTPADRTLDQTKQLADELINKL